MTCRCLKSVNVKLEVVSYMFSPACHVHLWCLPAETWCPSEIDSKQINMNHSLISRTVWSLKKHFFSLDHSKYRWTNAANWFWFLRVYLIVFYNEFKITPSTKWPARFLSLHYWEQNSRQTWCIDKRGENQNDLFLVIVAPCQLA